MDQVGPALRALRDAEDGVVQAKEQARKLVVDARATLADARETLAAAIVEDYLDGARVSDLAKDSEYSRETIRRILRAAGVDPE